MLAIDDIKKQYVIGGAGIFDSILQFLIRTFTSQTAKEAAKHVGKAALEAGKTVAVDAGKKLIDKALQPKKKVEDIISKYTAKGSAIAIQDLLKRLNKSGAGLKSDFPFRLLVDAVTHVLSVFRVCKVP